MGIEVNYEGRTLKVIHQLEKLLYRLGVSLNDKPGYDIPWETKVDFCKRWEFKYEQERDREAYERSRSRVEAWSSLLVGTGVGERHQLDEFLVWEDTSDKRKRRKR